MTLYDTGKLDNATGVFEIFKEINVLSDGLLASGMLILISIVLLVTFRGRAEFKDVFLGVSFMISFLAVIMFVLSLVNISIFFIPLIMLISAIIIKIWGA